MKSSLSLVLLALGAVPVALACQSSGGSSSEVPREWFADVRLQLES